MAQAATQPFKYQWNIRDIAAAPGDTVELRDRNQRLIKKVDASQMRILYAVKSSIEEAAEMSVELIIVDGKQPNAFAGKGKNGENIIGVNFAMLDILGLDVHAAAALIGHEIAHLKLNHGEQRAASQSATGVMKVLGGIALGSLGVPGGGLISDLTFTALATTYSRDNEREADYLGAIWAVEADYEPDGAVRLHEAVYQRSKTSPTPFLSSHPSGPERIATLKALSRRLSP
jgi:predicted Zn-dependent protease